MNVRTGEYLTILREELGDDLKIEASRTDTEWDTVFYQFHIYSKKLLIKTLKKEAKNGYRNGLADFREGGVIAVLDADTVVTADTFDEALRDFFYMYHEYKNNKEV